MEKYVRSIWLDLLEILKALNITVCCIKRLKA